MSEDEELARKLRREILVYRIVGFVILLFLFWRACDW